MKKYALTLLSAICIAGASESSYQLKKLNHSASVPSTQSIDIDDEFNLDPKKIEIFHSASYYHNTLTLWQSILKSDDADRQDVSADITKLKKECRKKLGYYDTAPTEFWYPGTLQKWIYFDPEKDDPLRWVKSLPIDHIDSILKRIAKTKEEPDLIMQIQNETKNSDQDTCSIQ